MSNVAGGNRLKNEIERKVRSVRPRHSRALGSRLPIFALRPNTRWSTHPPCLQHDNRCRYRHRYRCRSLLPPLTPCQVPSPPPSASRVQTSERERKWRVLFEEFSVLLKKTAAQAKKREVEKTNENGAHEDSRCARTFKDRKPTPPPQLNSTRIRTLRVELAVELS